MGSWLHGARDLPVPGAACTGRGGCSRASRVAAAGPPSATRLGWSETQGDSVQAVPLAGWSGPIIEDVAEVAFTSDAVHLSTRAEELAVRFGPDRAFKGSVETGPASPAVELVAEEYAGKSQPAQ